MSPFCETFFDNARALKKNVVGEVNKGWTVAKRLLQYERTSIGGIGGGTQQTTKLEDIAKDYIGVTDGRIADDATRQRVIAHRMNDRSFGLTMRRSMEESQSGRAPGAASSMFKYYGTEQNIRRYELLLSIMGTQAVGWSGDVVQFGRAHDDARVVALESELDRRRHVGSATQHSRETGARLAGLTHRHPLACTAPGIHRWQQNSPARPRPVTRCPR